LHEHKHSHRHPRASQDIAETHIDPWVYDKVEPNVEWGPLGRTNNEPSVDEYWKPENEGALT
jgi:hypothetical protein